MISPTKWCGQVTVDRKTKHNKKKKEIEREKREYRRSNKHGKHIYR